MLNIREERLGLTLQAMFDAAGVRKWGGMTRRERFYADCTEEESGCITHSGWLDKDGYPMVTFTHEGRPIGRRCSHIGLALKGIEVPKGQQVNHRCDNRRCVNTDHLFVGTQADNIKDMVEKDRHAVGERHTISLLTEDAVRDIRKHCGRTAPARVFAERYGVTESTIYAAKNRHNWSHVDA